MFSYGFHVDEGVAKTETISLNTTGATTAAIYLSKNSTGTFNTVAGVTVTIGSGLITIDITAAAATLSNFPAYYYVELDGVRRIEGVIRFTPLSTDTGTAGPHTHVEADVTNLETDLAAKAPTAHTHTNADVTGLTTHEAGLLSALPANGARPNGSTYLATDQNGGTPYKMVAGSWVQSGAGTNVTSNIIAGPVQMTGATSVDVKAIGAVATDVPGMSINVPANARGVLLRHKWEVQANSGTAAAGSNLRVIAFITDNANVVVASGGLTLVQVTAAAVIFQGQIVLEAYLPGPVAAGTYKLRVQLASAAPANWTSALLFPGNGNGGANSADNFYAISV